MIQPSRAGGRSSIFSLLSPPKPMRNADLSIRFLALFLALSLALPGPVLALRNEQIRNNPKETSGLEEKLQKPKSRIGVSFWSRSKPTVALSVLIGSLLGLTILTQPTQPPQNPPEPIPSVSKTSTEQVLSLSPDALQQLVESAMEGSALQHILEQEVYSLRRGSPSHNYLYLKSDELRRLKPMLSRYPIQMPRHVEPVQNIQELRDVKVAETQPYVVKQLWGEPIFYIVFQNDQIQGLAFDLLYLFVEARPGFLGKNLEFDVVSQEIELTGGGGMDFRMSDIARFFSETKAQGIYLNEVEERLKEELIQAGLLAAQGSGYVATTEAALLSTSQRASRADFAHEINHGIYFTDARYRQAAQGLWGGLSDFELTLVKDILAVFHYSEKDQDLLVREFIAFFRDPEELLRGYLVPYGDSVLGSEDGNLLHRLRPYYDEEGRLKPAVRETIEDLTKRVHSINLESAAYRKGAAGLEEDEVLGNTPALSPSDFGHTAIFEFAQKVVDIGGDAERLKAELSGKTILPRSAEDYLDHVPGQMSLVKAHEKTGQLLQFSPGLLYHWADNLDEAIMQGGLIRGSSLTTYLRAEDEKHIAMTRTGPSFAMLSKEAPVPATFLIRTEVFNSRLPSGKSRLYLRIVESVGVAEPWPSIEAPLPFDEIEEVWVTENTLARYRKISHGAVRATESFRVRLKPLLEQGKIRAVPGLRDDHIKPIPYREEGEPVFLYRSEEQGGFVNAYRLERNLLKETPFFVPRPAQFIDALRAASLLPAPLADLSAGLEEKLGWAEQAWEGVAVTPAYDGVTKQILPVFFERGTFSALPIAAKAGSVLILVASQSGLEEVRTLLGRLAIPLDHYQIRMVDGEGQILDALVRAEQEFSGTYHVYPVDPRRPDWFRQLMAGLEEQGNLPVGDLEPAIQAAQDYFQFV